MKHSAPIRTVWREAAARDAHHLRLSCGFCSPVTSPEPVFARALPYPPNSRFVGCDDDLCVLAALLRPERALVALCGIGRLSSTQLTLEFAHRYSLLIPKGVLLSQCSRALSISVAVRVEVEGREHVEATGGVIRHTERQLAIVERLPGQRGFEAQAKRWVVERTRAWLSGNRQLSRGYDHNPRHSESWL